MATARWSLRLPRAYPLRHAKFENTTTLPKLVTPTNQKRWTTQPSKRTRPWASSVPSGKQVSENRGHEKFLRQGEMQRQEAHEQQPGRNAQLATVLAQADSSDLVTDVNIPSDPHGVLPRDHPALSILGNSSLVIQRQIEMMNVMLSFEQANRYIIMDGQGQTLGYVAEQDHGMGRAVARQMFRTHRSFTAYIFDQNEREVLRIHRPFAYINSRIRIYDPLAEGEHNVMDTSTALQGTSLNSTLNSGGVSQISQLKLDQMRIIGEAQQQWAPLRRKYNLFSYRPISPAQQRDSTQRIESGERPSSDTKAVTEAQVPEQSIEAGMTQFSHVNEPFLSWDFTLRDEEQKLIGNVNRNFGGFAREIFTDTGVYALRMDSASQMAILENSDGKELGRYEKEATAMTLDQRAVMLATAVSIDFDYFSRHSHAGSGGFFPFLWPMGGGAAEGGAAGAGAGAAGGAAVGEAAGATGTAVGAAEGAAGAVGGAATRGLGTAAGPAGESAIAGAGTMAGYEAMQRGVYGPRGGEDASPTNSEPFAGADGSNQQSPEQSENRPGNDDVWGESEDPWGRGGPGDGPPPSAGGESGEGGGGWMDTISDFFGDS